MAKMRLQPLDPGELNRRVTVEQLTQSTGPTGAPIEEWSDLADVMMNKLDLRGSERLEAAQLSSPFDTVWQTWYRADLDPDTIDVPKVRRLNYQGRIYDITRVMPIEISGIRHGLEFETIAAARV